MNTPSNKEAQGRYRVRYEGTGARIIDVSGNPKGREELCFCYYNGDAEMIRDALNSHPAESAERERVKELEKFIQEMVDMPARPRGFVWKSLWDKARALLHES